tara:strand:+ start:817 stop:1602 length:786 start_codon:yes stop_codon:yes gene_type:complete
VIIVDSSSSDGSKNFLQVYQPNFLFKYHIQANKGKAAARNKAVDLSQGDIIIITDADMIPDHYFVQRHIEAHASINKAACFEGLAWNMTSLAWPPISQNLAPQVGKNHDHMNKLGWYYFLTGNISLPRLVFDQFLGFNERFTGYGWEDLELGYRLFKQKIPLYYLTTAINYHYHIINPSEELQRNVKKGESAKLFLELHPELKWFLGFNPLSTWIFPKISEQSMVFKWFKAMSNHSKSAWIRAIGMWFLKEFFYLKGALKF